MNWKKCCLIYKEDTITKMEIKFVDSKEADVQDRVCSILASLCLVVDVKKHMSNFGKGTNTYWVYWHEMEHHFNWAMFNTLRLLGILTHSDVGNSANVDRLCDMGHTAFEDLIRELAESFDVEAE